MSNHTLLSSEVSADFQNQIEIFEKKTSCEIRIHIEEQNDAAVLDRAAFVFDHLGMHKTKQRNALLVYIQIYPSALAIIGDVGIHPHVDAVTWEKWKNQLIHDFSQRNFTKGMSQLLDDMAAHLAPAFPWQANDINELSDTISR
jgi:uncharacterized membrane protein